MRNTEIKDKLIADLEETLKGFISRNKSFLTDLITESYIMYMDNMVKNSIQNAISYYRAQAQEDVDFQLSKRISIAVKDNFGTSIDEAAKKLIEEKINSEVIDNKIDKVIDINLNAYLKKEIKDKVKELISSRELKISV